MIPRRLHLCWYGDKVTSDHPHSQMITRCAISRLQFCEGWECIYWSEKNTDLHANRYVHDAYAHGKYAFVSDYQRLKALYDYGGVYLDTDVELRKPLDPFLRHAAFSGFQSVQEVPAAVMGAEAGHPFIKELLDYYDTALFVKDDGSLNYRSNNSVITEMTVRHGLRQDGTLQVIRGMVFYPPDFFALDPEQILVPTTDRTVSVHYCMNSWNPTGKDE